MNPTVTPEQHRDMLELAADFRRVAAAIEHEAADANPGCPAAFCLAHVLTRVRKTLKDDVTPLWKGLCETEDAFHRFKATKGGRL